MLPKFPEFKKLELSDQKDIQNITSKYQPYSDFNFESMWAWNVGNKFGVSQLNGNLVVILTDHFSDRLFYSFLGINKINLTIKQLFAFPIGDDGLAGGLRLVPEESLENIDLSKYLIEIDINNCDYIYDLNRLSTYLGSHFATKRYMANMFIKNHNPVVRLLDLAKANHKSAVKEINKIWIRNKNDQDTGVNLDKEIMANQRFLAANFKNALAVGVFVGNRLVGYSLFTCLPNKYTICHFAKANTAYAGVYEYMMKESAKILLSKGSICLNYEEDLGLPGLRFSKNSFNPLSFLRKYTISEL
jgi:uncharacterized protein